MSVAGYAGTSIDWRAALEALKAHLGPAFGRAETRASGGAFLDGLLSGAARKTGWMLAQEAGLDRPDRIQSLLGSLGQQPLVGGRAAWAGAGLRHGGAWG